jgi:hypothetical protein
MEYYKRSYLYHLWQIIKQPRRKKNYFLLIYDDNPYDNITIDRFFKDPYMGFDLSENYRYYNIISCEYKGKAKDNYYGEKIVDEYRVLVECYQYYSEWEANKYYKKLEKEHKQYKKEYEKKAKTIQI